MDTTVLFSSARMEILLETGRLAAPKYPPYVYCYVKSQFTLEQAMKAQKGSRGIVLLFP
jgi:hypothetical protein